MSLMTPTLLSTEAFDATKEKTFKFAVTGGDQVAASYIEIWFSEISTEDPVYSGSELGFRLEHTVPANSLENGQYYKARIKTLNSDGDESDWSNYVQFRCFNEPKISFTNIPIDGVINNSTYNFIAEYNKVLEEYIIDSLESYTFFLYDSTGAQIGTSGIKYFTEEQEIPTNIEYTFKGFDDNAIYGIKVIGTTMNGMFVDSGVSQFTADYEYPSAFSLLTLENVCSDGYIRIISDVSIIDGVAVPDPPTYIDGKEIDLSQDGASVSWTEGWTTNGNFTLGIWGRKFRQNKRVCLMNAQDSNYRIELYSRKGSTWDAQDNVVKFYFDCYIYSNNETPSYIVSNYIDIPNIDDEICIWLTRQNNVFELKILNRGVV